jgi:hypothetical protein
MDAQEISFGLNAVMSMLFGTGGALGVWFTLKNRVNLLQQTSKMLADDNKIAHERIDSLKDEVRLNREKADNGIADIKKDIADTKLEIIKEIHKLTK